jgi:beta-lactamase regulating signal transducer with metallopeptidase domain
MIGIGEAVIFGAGLWLKGMALLALGLVAASLVQRRAARLVAVWRMTFAAAVALPWLALLLPSWNVAAIDVRHDAIASSAALWIVSAWAIVAALLLIRLARDVLAAFALARRASLCDDARALALLHRATTVVPTARLPQLRETTELATAALVGWRRPIILLPADARDWSSDELLGVLCHELEHSRRHDWLALVAERVVVALLWLNPLAYVAARAAAGARELAADDAVLRGSVNIDAYATRLIASARTSVRGPCLAVTFSTEASVGKRVRALFESRRDRRPLEAPGKLRIVVVALPLLLGVATAQPWGCVPGATSAARVACP